MNSLPSQPTEELPRYYGWDEDLARLLLALPRPVIDQYIVQEASYDKDGWHYILPDLPSSASVLCLDARYGTTALAFAERVASVTVIHPCPVTLHIIQRRLVSLNIPNVTTLHIPPEATRLPFGDAAFDAFLHHDVAGTLIANPVAAKSPFAVLTATLLNEAYRLLKPDGFAYFGAKNRHSYTEWRSRINPRLTRKPSTLSPTSMRRAKQLIRRAGFSTPVVSPYLVERDHVSEIIPPSGYQSVKNTLSASETLKQAVLGTFGARLLAPAYGLVCCKGGRHATQLQPFADDLVARSAMARPDDTQPCFRRYFCMPGKVFVTLGPAVGGNENIMIVIPKLQRVQAWRRKEIDIVNELRTLSPFLAAKLPRLYFESSCRGQTYFVISEIAGITIDRHVPHLAQLTHNALEFLIRFNHITARATTITREVYARLIGHITQRVADTYPETRVVMEAIDHHIRAAVINESIASVWLHGDYKLENLIFDRNTLEIAGIIDWEHSCQDSLPWLDLLYLIAYNRIMTEERDFFDVYRTVILDGAFSKHELPLVNAYAEALPVPAHMRIVLTALFLLHHIGFRYKYDKRMPTDMDNILTALSELEMRLARVASHRL
jgi:SAM-dependent methyltransferase